MNEVLSQLQGNLTLMPCLQEQGDILNLQGIRTNKTLATASAMCPDDMQSQCLRVDSLSLDAALSYRVVAI